MYSFFVHMSSLFLSWNCYWSFSKVFSYIIKLFYHLFYRKYTCRRYRSLWVHLQKSRWAEPRRCSSLWLCSHSSMEQQLACNIQYFQYQVSNVSSPPRRPWFYSEWDVCLDANATQISRRTHIYDTVLKKLVK